MRRDFCIDVFWKDVNISVTRVGKSCRSETQKPLQNLKEKKYENRARLIVSDNKNHVCTSSKYFNSLKSQSSF